MEEKDSVQNRQSETEKIKFIIFHIQLAQFWIFKHFQPLQYTESHWQIAASIVQNGHDDIH